MEGDMELKDDIKAYVAQNLRQTEIVDFLKVKYPMYAWSVRTLSRRMHHFDIKYIEYDTNIDDVTHAVEKEMNGPGRLLGYRALHKKIREVHTLNVPRNVVYDVMTDVNPQGLQDRGGVGQPKRQRRKGAFTSTVSIKNVSYFVTLEHYINICDGFLIQGADFTMSLDGHDKMCGFQKSTFPLCIYGAQDTFSSRVNFLRVWTSNNNPSIVGRFYFDYLFERRGIIIFAFI
jgi:hypothetical protein